MMNRLMLSCKKASELIEKGLHFKLTLKERIQLKMHTSVCDACKSFVEDSERFEQAMRILIHSDPVLRNEDRLSNEVRERILQAIKAYPG